AFCNGLAAICVFFFQAEDGIRDFHVTGVQTCALPISRRVELLAGGPRVPRVVDLDGGALGGLRAGADFDVLDHELRGRGLAGREIGRASCRERVSVWGGGGTVSSKRRGGRQRR